METFDGQCRHCNLGLHCFIFSKHFSSPRLMTLFTLQGDQASFEVLAQSFHYGQIMGLDVCARKPLIASCSMDKSVRVWNYETWYAI